MSANVMRQQSQRAQGAALEPDAWVPANCCRSWAIDVTSLGSSFPICTMGRLGQHRAVGRMQWVNEAEPWRGAGTISVCWPLLLTLFSLPVADC